MSQQPHVDLKHYRRLRAILTRHQNAAVKSVPRTAFRKLAKTFGLLKGDKLLLESEGELTILFDFLIYHHRQRGKTLVQKYLARLPAADDPDEAVVRRAMGSPRFSVFEVTAARPRVGVAVRDRARGGTLFVVDEGLSRSAKPGAFFALRLLPLPDYWMTSGAGFPLRRQVVQLIRRVFLPALRMTEGHPLAHLSPEAEDELATVVTGAAIKDGTTGAIEFR
jgi:hypothetical protein